MRRIYAFDDAWSVAAPYDLIFDVLEDLEGYPTWWPDVEAVARLDPDRGLVTIRSVLPYRLRFNVTRERVDRELGSIAATMDGDLGGWTRWLLRPLGDGARRRNGGAAAGTGVDRWPLLSALEPLLAPAYAANHALMVRRGRVGLREAVSAKRRR